jgi:hypothetical protein
MIWIYISIYVAIMIATFIARMEYFNDFMPQQERERDIWLSVIYSIFWPIGFLSTLIYRFFVWMR